MKIPLVNLGLHHKRIIKEINQAIKNTIYRSSFIIGPELEKFENNFAKFIGSKYAVGVASGTAALHLALLAVGIKKGDEVITVSHTFAATAEAIVFCGARPVLVDIDEDTFNINIDLIEEKITKKTKAIIPVHLYGHPCDMDLIRLICRKYKLRIIEDCAQAHGAEYKEKKVGSIGDAGCFSFFPAKNLGALGDGGIVTTNSKRIAQKVRMLRNHGRKSKYLHETIGFGERLDNLQAAILDIKLKKLEKNNQLRRKWAKLYSDLLKDTGYILPIEKSWAKHVYYVYTIRYPKRDKIIHSLKSLEIGSGIYYPIPIHFQPSFKYLGYKQGDFPITEKIVKEIFSIPMFPELTQEEVKHISSSILEMINK